MKLRDIRTLVNVEAPARSVADKLARTATVSTTPAGWRPNAFPPSIFDYLEGGAEDEVSLRRNRSSFDDWFFVPRWGAIENLDLTSTVLGKPTALPSSGADRRDPAFPPGRRTRRCPCGVGSGHSVRIGAPEYDADGIGQRGRARPAPMVQHRTGRR